MDNQKNTGNAGGEKITVDEAERLMSLVKPDEKADTGETESVNRLLNTCG
jgi:hypothetical protein